MGQERDIPKEPSEVIEEIEAQLDTLLQRKIDDIERDLAARISQEKEAALRRKDEVEREFAKEREALADYRGVVRAAEEERSGLLNEARTHFDKVVELQAEIESLAKATVAEIRKVTELQERIEELRQKTAERSGFLKADLRERFGIAADVFGEHERPVNLDLDQELEKLRKIKELLAIESAAVGLGEAPRSEECAEDYGDIDIPGPSAAIRIPEIQELVAELPASPERKTARLAEAGAGIAAESVFGPEPEARPAAVVEPEEAVAAALELCRRTEPADGSGEIHYFQKDSKILLDGESIFFAIDKTVEESERLSAKLGQTESPKDQFFLKQELINWQEGLRAMFLRIIKMTEKKIWELPKFTEDILNSQSLRALLERLSMENWSNPEEFAAFTAAAAELKRAYLDRLTPRGVYLRALKKELDSR